MDTVKTGNLIKTFRLEKGMTQKELADKLCLSDKTISKWERGLGCPDPAIWDRLSNILGVGVDSILKGEIESRQPVGGNMKKSKYYVCPQCGNILFSTAEAELMCCGRKLEAMEARKADQTQKLIVEMIEDDWYITSDHPMEKENYITFVAFAAGDRVQLYKQYPEWNMQVRFQKRGHGTLFWYSTTQGFLYQLI